MENVNNPLSSSNPFITNTERLHSSVIPYPGTGGGGMANPSSNAPPVPPRQNPESAYRSSGYSNYSPYSNLYGGSNYGGFGLGSYGSGGGSYGSPYSMYGRGGSYGNYGMYGGLGGGGVGGYGNYGMNYGEPPSFTQLAEESSASAFQSIESFVNAFGSISAMLDSTFHALYSSFRAVVGVADHLGRLKQIFSALAIFRFARWVVRRFLYLVGISKIKPEDVESLWKTLSDNSSGGGGGGDNILDDLSGGRTKPSSWPIIMFLGFIFAGPYLMWKLIKSFNLNSKERDNSWSTGSTEHFVARANYDFEGQSGELRVKSGQTIRLAPAKFQPQNVKGWVLASDGVNIGLVPTNYIKVIGKRNGQGQINNMAPFNQSKILNSANENSSNINDINAVNFSAANLPKIEDFSPAVTSGTIDAGHNEMLLPTIPENETESTVFTTPSLNSTSQNSE